MKTGAISYSRSPTRSSAARPRPAKSRRSGRAKAPNGISGLSTTASKSGAAAMSNRTVATLIDIARKIGVPPPWDDPADDTTVGNADGPSQPSGNNPFLQSISFDPEDLHE